MKILLDAQIDSIASKVDGTVSVKIGTQELTGKKAGELFDFRKKHCKVLISDDNITPAEVALVSGVSLTKTTQKKSKSQRLRDTFFRLYEKTQPAGMDFNEFYSQQMEDVINSVKSKLE